MTEQVIDKQGSRLPLLIFVGCCFCAASGLALTVSLMGVYLVPVSKAMGLSPTEFTLWSAALGITQVITFPLWGQIMRKHFKISFLIGVICEVVGILLFTVVNSVPGLILIGILFGIAMPLTFFLTVPTLISNWFAPKYRGKFLGIAMAFSGIGTFCWAPLFTTILGSLGYQMAYIINAILAAVLLLPWLFVFKFSPESVGQKPYGYVAEDASLDEQASSKNGLSAKKALSMLPFYLLFGAVAFTAIGMGFNNSQSAMAGQMLAGTDMVASAAIIGAWMISTAAAGNLIGKIVYGFLADKFGVKSTTIIYFVMFFLAFVVWMLFPGNLVAMFIGAFLLGTHNGIASVGLPMITRILFGGYDYEKIYARLSIGSGIVGGFSTTIVTMLAASVGGYVGVAYFGLGIGLVVLIAVCLIPAMAFIGKIKWDHTGDKEE
jgi:MFS family permease